MSHPVTYQNVVPALTGEPEMPEYPPGLTPTPLFAWSPYVQSIDPLLSSERIGKTDQILRKCENGSENLECRTCKIIGFVTVRLQ